ncbi:pyridoxal phosphate-dependent aminotransferase [Leptospira levettii]|uniref:pyridoxal phosphate-dependent aminotransferase n=1 Tax=Leptospira levettii TaxID=2023178 RepID=UPI001EEBEEBB|nr:pyridoxal phosphate-dependent aminotransferase [Leptospira levettii]MCG6150179.1 pyridoxal phosphate-dependent aminotransferase [Leptospira levettii]
MEPREFFIEDRLERFRLNAFCNLGESGLSHFTMEEMLSMAGLHWKDLSQIPMYDAPNQGSYDLRLAIANLYPGVSPEEVLVTTGTGEALYIVFQLLVKPKDSLALIWPAFQALYEIPKMLGANILPIPYTNAFSASTWEGIEADLYLINHPHNPSGMTFATNEWDSLLKLLQRKKKTVVFDEHYRFLPKGGGMGKTGVDPKQKFYGTGSFTKCFGVTGLRVGWLIADKDFIKRARSFKDYLTHTVNPLSERIALGLLKEKETFLPNIQTRVQNNIDHFTSVWRELPKVEFFSPPEGGLVGWLQIQNSIRSEDYADKLFDRTGVFVLPGSNFEMEGFLRIGFGAKEDVFLEGLKRWKSCTDLI